MSSVYWTLYEVNAVDSFCNLSVIFKIILTLLLVPKTYVQYCISISSVVADRPTMAPTEPCH